MTTIYAFFDFDGTLTTKDSLIPFLRYISGNWIFFINIILVLPYLLGYFFKFIPNDVAKQKLISIFLKNKKVSDIQELSKDFNSNILSKMLREEGMEKLRMHQEQGHICVLVSASLEIYLTDWAKKQGFDYIIGTRLEENSGIITGQFFGNNCFGKEKVLRINHIFEKECWEHSFAYTDSLVDIPLLEASEKGYILNNKEFEVFVKK